MQTILKSAALAATLAASAAHAQVAFDANLELDTTYTNEVKNATNARDSDLALGGRIEVNAGAKATNGDAFVAARASLLLKKDGDTGVDDMWVQFGNKTLDAKLGRFEAVDLFPPGKDVLIEEAGYSAYKGNALRGRFSKDTFHAALGVNAGTGLRFELGLVQTKEQGEAKGVRPVLVYSNGPLTLRGGFESVKTVGGGESQTGVGFSVGYALNKETTLNVNLAKKEDDKGFGVNIVTGPLGVGFIHGKGATEAQKVNTLYAGYSLPLMGVKGAMITPAVSYSKGGPGTDDQVGVRVRINYAF